MKTLLIIASSIFISGYTLNAAFAFRHHFIDTNLPGSEWGQTAIADINKDGKPDYITGKSRGQILLYLQKSKTNWTRTILGENSPSEVGGAVYDVDEDGWLDFVAGGAWYKNPGKEPFEKFERIVFDPALARVHDLFLADINGNGKKDVVTMSDQNNLRWYEIPANPREAWKRTDIGQSVHAGVGLGDIDKDGDLDVVRSDTWFENADGKGEKWTAHKTIPFGNPNKPFPLATHCVVIDLDRDGDNDLVMTENEIRGGRIAFIENIDGKGEKWLVHPLPANDAAIRGAYHSLIVADFDNDGDPDIFSCEMEGISGDKPPRWFIWENVDGRGKSFKEHTILDANLGSHLVVAGDIDGDGDLDLIGKCWNPRKDNALNGKNHIDLLENLTVK
ncbi:MAG: FG-GAP repeat domain-containing protein [Verrucomicrobiia bacterium]